MTHRRDSGFSLVELLTVIAVMAILGAILVPVASTMLGKSDIVKSTSNVRSIGSATLIYAQENEGAFPVWHDYRSGGKGYWWQALRLYLDGSDALFASPAHEEFDATSDTTLAETISYGWNYIVMGRHKGDSTFSGDHVGKQYSYPHPAKTLVLTDGPRLASWGYIDPFGHAADPERYGNSMAVALFLDGKVDVMAASTFLTEDPYFIGPVAMPNSSSQ